MGARASWVATAVYLLPLYNKSRLSSHQSLLCLRVCRCPKTTTNWHFAREPRDPKATTSKRATVAKMATSMRAAPRQERDFQHRKLYILLRLDARSEPKTTAKCGGPRRECDSFEAPRSRGRHPLCGESTTAVQHATTARGIASVYPRAFRRR